MPNESCTCKEHLQYYPLDCPSHGNLDLPGKPRVGPCESRPGHRCCILAGRPFGVCALVYCKCHEVKWGHMQLDFLQPSVCQIDASDHIQPHEAAMIEMFIGNALEEYAYPFKDFTQEEKKVFSAARAKLQNIIRK